MAFEIEGILHKKYDTESKTETFRTREFVILTEETYPQYIKFQMTQDRCEVIDPFNEGDKLKVHFDLRGRAWQDKFFTNLNAWKVEKVSAAEAPITDSGDFGEPIPPPSADDLPELTEDDDLPF